MHHRLNPSYAYIGRSAWNGHSGDEDMDGLVGKRPSKSVPFVINSCVTSHALSCLLDWSQASFMFLYWVKGIFMGPSGTVCLWVWCLGTKDRRNVSSGVHQVPNLSFKSRFFLKLLHNFVYKRKILTEILAWSSPLSFRKLGAVNWTNHWRMRGRFCGA